MNKIVQATPMAVSLLAATNAAVSSTGDPGTDFASYGLIGVVMSVLIYFIKAAWERERDRADKLEIEVTRLRDVIEHVPQTPARDPSISSG